MSWARPWHAEGWDCDCIDLKNGRDVRLLHHLGRQVDVILAAPPCTDFSVSGAQYWPAKDKDGSTLTSLAIVDACLRAVAIYKPRVWALENPVGRLRRWLGPPQYQFDPCDFGGYVQPDERTNELAPPRDAYTKKTMLWGRFNHPVKQRVDPIRACSQGSWVQQLGGKSERTKELRSATPIGFARAFFEANKS